jgi:nucleoside-diphosphate-sugar epimerase
MNASASSRAAVSGSASLPALDAPRPSDPRTGTTRSLFCFGLGYTSLGLAETLRRAGWRVAGTCRSAERARALEAAGIPAFVWCPAEKKFLGDDGAAALRDATHVLVSVPPTERETSEHNREDTLSIDPVLADAACVAALERSGAEENEIAWLAYLSSTGVYGDHAGKFVDETSPCAPTTAKTRARLDAERAWAAFARSGKGPKGTNRNLPLRVFRLGGVYGPRRSLLDAAARANGSETSTSTSASASARPNASRSSSRFSRAFVARCHVRDVVAILCASMSQADDERRKTNEAFDSGGGPNAVKVPDIRTYNAADDAPAPRAVALAFAAALLKTDVDVRNETEPTKENEPSVTKNKNKIKNDRGEKRVRNDRAKTELGVAFAFPTYKEGLAAIADGDPSPFSDATLDVL